jgi:hypothetical protein
MPAFAKLEYAEPLSAKLRSKLSATGIRAAAPAPAPDTTETGSTTSSLSAAVSLVVATPCFGGQISVHYASSLLRLQMLARGYRNLNLKVLFKDGDALITRARASLISQFLDDPGATHLLFIDADIGFDSEQVLRLIQSGADMSAAVYPIKRIDWDKVKRTIEIARPSPAAAALQYVLEVYDPNAVIEQAGFVKVRYAGTGFLMVRRQALERMCAHYPQLKFKRDHSIDAATVSDNRFALFECMIAEDGTYLSEDFAFCKRWTDMGGEIWADLKSKLTHVGPMAFHGDLSSQFAAAEA